ncbi:MAG TPA: histidine triad nucleotide-binding protein [Chloroflexota bacterium]
MAECLFCRIIAGEVPGDFVYQDEEVVAFRDINPQAPVHVLVMPRKHIENYAAATPADDPLLGRLARTTAEIARDQGVLESGFRCVVNNGPDAQQSVPHLHVHVLGGRATSWPPG